MCINVASLYDIEKRFFYSNVARSRLFHIKEKIFIKKAKQLKRQSDIRHVSGRKRSAGASSKHKTPNSSQGRGLTQSRRKNYYDY